MPEKEIVSEEAVATEVPKRRVGRPRKTLAPEGLIVEEKPKQRVGRPRKTVVSEELIVEEKPKRRVGRPRKTIVSEELIVEEAPQRHVGRPKKSASACETENDMLPLTLGVILQQARQKQHIKLSSVSKKLCIKETYLKALEEGHYYVFPALVYGAGFLRAYATFLGLDANELAERFRRETTDIKVEPLDMPRVSEPGAMPKPKTIVKSILALVLLYLIWNVVKIMTHNPFPEPTLPAVEESRSTDEQAVPVTVDELAPTQSEQKSGNKIEKDQVKKETKSAKTEEASASQVPVKVGVSYGLKTPARVSFLATDSVKIEILDTEANSILFQKTLEPGDRYNPVDGVEGMVLRTTNAGGLDVYIDGKKVKTLGKKGQIKTSVSMSAKDLLKD